MGYTTSTVHGIQVPDSAQANNIPTDLGNVVTALEGGSIIRRLTGAQISALTGPQKPAGLVVYNTTTNTLQVSDGSSFNALQLAKAIYAEGQRTTTQAFNDATPTTITYDSESDPFSFLTPASGVVTIPAAGVWLLALRAAWSADFVGLTEARLRNVSGGTILASQRMTSDGWSARNVALTTAVRLSAGTTIDAQLYQDSTGSQTCGAATFTAVMIGTS